MSRFDEFAAVVAAVKPATAVVLGSGQSGVLASIKEAASIGFAEVPGLVAPSVAGHSGRIIVGTVDDVPLLLFQGRLHFYEGHSWEKVAAPVKLAAKLGVRNLLLTNAAGGIHPKLDPGSFMFLRDHLFLQRPTAWREPGPATCSSPGGARPGVYSDRLLDCLDAAASDVGEAPIRGVYAAMTGPCYETPSEIRALQAWGVDAVGMSTAWEAETGRSLGLECAAISAITNKGAGLVAGELDHHDVLEVMARIRKRLGRLIAAFLKRAA